MRDLKADLKGLQANSSDWTELPRGLVVEVLERAIEGESQRDKAKQAAHMWQDRALKAENQVAKMQRVVDAAEELYKKRCKNCKACFYAIGDACDECSYGIIKQVLAEQEASR